MAIAGADASAVEGTLVQLDGSASRAGGREPLAYAWTQLSGEPVALQGADEPRPTFLAPGVLGPLVLELTVNEGSASSRDEVRITILGREPEPESKKVQLHLHGHSNHNGASNPASMQWHSAWGSETGAADVLWWSDHAPALDLRQPVRIDFVHGTLDADTMEVAGLEAQPLDPLLSFTRLRPEVSGGTPGAHLDAAGLGFTLRADPGGDWQTFGYVSRSAQSATAGLQPVHDRRFNRPLSSVAALELDADFGPSTEQTLHEVVVWLAWHRSLVSIQHRIRFRFVSAGDWTTPRIVAEDEVLVPVVVDPAGLYHLDLLANGGLLHDGDDNTISNLAFEISAREGAQAAATLRGLDIVSLSPAPEHQVAVLESLAGRYEQRYGLVEHVGFEQHHPQELHMNALLPAGEPVLPHLVDTGSEEDTRAWVAGVHASGGLVSWNHPFGTASWTNLEPDGDRAQRLREMARTLLDTGAFDADLLEIGYLNRGGMSLRDHLTLWDILLANRLFLTGIGVSDSHGGPWATWQGPSSFTTWVLSTDTRQDALIGHLRNREAYLGNPFTWDGRFTLSAGAARMGDIARIEEDRTVLTFEFAPWDPAVRLFLVQGLVQEGLDVTYVQDRIELRDASPVVLDTRRSSFVRLEAFSTPENLLNRWSIMVLTNPILLLRED